jgi:hypothetical protein
MRTTAKRVPVPFLFRAADGLGANGKVMARSYGAEVDGVFTRAGTATNLDSVTRIYTAAHSVPRFGRADQTTALLLEGAGTNYLLQSQAFNTTWSKTNVTVGSDAVTAPDGTTTADKIEATASAATTLYQVEATISSTVVTYSIHGKIGSGATDANKFRIRNDTTV